MTDEDGTILERYRYNVYGEHKVLNSDFTTKSTPAISPFLWSGSLYEPETDLYWMRNRYYHKDMHRFINQDPIGIWGDANNLGNGFAYVAGMVIEASDPTGLETEVIFWAPAGFGKSSFGHVSVRINDISYSWSPGGMDARPASFYEQINNFRDGEGIILNISTEEEENLENYLSGYAKESGEWTPVDNNCTKPITSWINKNFDKKIKSYLPSNVKIDIINNGMGKETTWHPQSENGTNNQSNSDSSTNYDDPEIPSSISPFYLGPDSDPEEEEEKVPEPEPEPEPEPQEPEEEGSGASFVKVCDKDKKNCICVSGSCPTGNSSSGVDDPEDIFQKYIASKIISRMLKQGESDQPPVFKDNSTGPNGATMFYRNPYYINKDPMKTLIKEGHSGRGFMFVRNPFAPTPNYNPYNSTADFWFHSGFNRGEIGPGWE